MYEEGKRMRLVGRHAGVWVLVAGMAAGVAVAQPAQQGQQKGALPNAPVPDAPKPQIVTMPTSITPVAPISVGAPAESTSGTVAGSTAAVPATPVPTAVTQADDKYPAPDEHETPTIRVRVNYVDIPFTVKDSKGRLVPGLTYRDVRVYENGVRQQPRVFTTDPAPLSVALVIDQSVTPDTMDKINASLAALQGAFTPYDEVAVFTYNNGVTERDGFSAAQGARLGVILDRSKGHGIEPVMGLGGPISQTLIKNNQIVDPNTTAVRGQQGITLNTPREFHVLNDAILQAAQLLATADRGRRRVIFVIGEGKEYGSTAKESQVIKFLQKNQIALYATLVGDTSVPGLGFLDRIHLPLTMRDNILPRYAAATGGECDPEFRPRGIQESFSKISEMVRNQYTIGYYSSEPVLDGKYRKTEVRVMRPGLTVVAKEGYYPSPESSMPPSARRPVASTTPAAQP
jgi:VWFA-related protein